MALPGVLVKALTSRWALLGMALILIAAQYYLLQRANEKVGRLKALQREQVAQTQLAADANETCIATVSELEASLAALAEARRLDREKADAVIADREERLSRAARRAAEERRARRELWNSTQSCTGLAALRVDLACSPVAERLRERSAGPGGDGDPDG
jgi:hypothetical protein